MNEQQNMRTTSESKGENPTPGAEYTLSPDVDIYEDEEGIFVQADMPGVSRDRLHIEVNKDALTIEGEARIDMPEGIEALWADVQSTHYRRTFVLSSELDTNLVEATLKEGVLSIRIPKRAEAKPRKIEVTGD